MRISGRQVVAVLCSILALSSLSSCTGESTGVESSSTPLSPEAMSSPGTGSPRATEPGPDLSGRTIAIDPGHNGENGRNPGEISRLVPDGRGGTKACNTTGTATDSDYTEAEFTWDVGSTLAAELEKAGAEVILSRQDNDGVGPCVDERGKFAEEADLLVSIHANGSESSKTKGFHVIVAEPAMSAELEAPSNRLAEVMSEAMSEDFTPNEAYGKNAISRRDDLAGLNNASVPAVIVECGEMRNPEEAERMESEAGRSEYAAALLRGIVNWY